MRANLFRTVRAGAAAVNRQACGERAMSRFPAIYFSLQLQKAAIKLGSFERGRRRTGRQAGHEEDPTPFSDPFLPVH